MSRYLPVFNDFVPRWLRPWIFILTAFCFQLTGSVYGGVLSHFMGEHCLIREDAMMITLCGVVGSNMPFPFLFRLKFRYTNQQLLMTAAIVIGICNLLMTRISCVPLLCIISFVAGFYKICGTFECMSSAQLWMTHKRDFTLFFPMLYSFVLGNMSLSPYLSLHLAYSYSQWQMMSYLMAGIMFILALVFFLCTHPFRIMPKPMPLYGIDFLGMLLWSAVLLEIIFLFNYGEFYNWWQSAQFRGVVCLLPLTIYLTVGRMTHVRHPYIAPEAWNYRRLPMLLTLFAIMELAGSTPKVLQTAYLGSILHYGPMQTDVIYLIEVLGTVTGCSFIVYWQKVLHLRYTRLLTLGAMALLAYEVMLYFLVTPGLSLTDLYPAIYLRTFGTAIFFTVLTIYLHDLMHFQHFFMSLTIVGMIRTGAMSTICSGIFSFHLRRLVADNLSRGWGYDGTQLMLISLKQLYGVASILALIVLFAFLLWDLQPAHRIRRHLPDWRAVGRFLTMREG